MSMGAQARCPAMQPAREQETVTIHHPQALGQTGLQGMCSETVVSLRRMTACSTTALFFRGQFRSGSGPCLTDSGIPAL